MFAIFSLVPLLQRGADAQRTPDNRRSVKLGLKRNARKNTRAFSSSNVSKERAGKKAVVKC
ncbi:MAG: hypothetical protein KF749_00875 [Bacteroidetes bacterium]|nr:hypothetical protein [Bacteroidota bacterium]